MSAPEAVVFDLGKVLLDFDYGIAVRGLQGFCDISEVQLRARIDQSPLLLRYECADISTEEFFDEVTAHAGFRGTLADFSAQFGDIFHEIEPMVQLHAELRKKGVPAYVFSNTNAIAIEHIRKRFPFFRDFDGYILSYEHGAMKPDSRLYDMVERIAGRTGSKLLYIDDRPENIAAGVQRGWRTILHEKPEATIAAVKAAGFTVAGCET